MYALSQWEATFVIDWVHAQNDPWTANEHIEQRCIMYTPTYPHLHPHPHTQPRHTHTHTYIYIYIDIDIDIYIRIYVAKYIAMIILNTFMFSECCVKFILYWYWRRCDMMFWVPIYWPQCQYTVRYSNSRSIYRNDICPSRYFDPATRVYEDVLLAIT